LGGKELSELRKVVMKWHMGKDISDKEREFFADWFYTWNQTACSAFSLPIGSADLLRKLPEKLSDEERQHFAEVIYRSTRYIQSEWLKNSAHLRFHYREEIITRSIDLQNVIADILTYFEPDGVPIKVVAEENIPPVKGHHSWLVEAIRGYLTDLYYPTPHSDGKEVVHTISIEVADKNTIRLQIHTVANSKDLSRPYLGVNTAVQIVEQFGGDVTFDSSSQAADIRFILQRGSEKA
jgi:hypothetical protein